MLLSKGCAEMALLLTCYDTLESWLHLSPATALWKAGARVSLNPGHKHGVSWPNHSSEVKWDGHSRDALPFPAICSSRELFL